MYQLKSQPFKGVNDMANKIIITTERRKLSTHEKQLLCNKKT